MLNSLCVVVQPTVVYS